MANGPSGNQFQDMCTMVGLMTVTWSWTENALAISIALIDEKCGAIRGHSELPLSLKQRLSYLKNALADVSVLKPLQKDGTALVELITTLKHRRHELTHGSVFQMPDGGFQALQISALAKKYAGAPKQVEIGEVVLLNKEISAMTDRAVDFLRRIDGLLNV